MRGEPEPAIRPDPGANLLLAHPVVVDLLIEAECQEVTSARRNLVTHQEQDPVVPALPAVAARGERVMVGQEHHVHRVGAGCRQDLGHRGGPVRVRRMDMRHAGKVVQVGVGRHELILSAMRRNCASAH
jgi:hypothetical protein